jgi:hypothetical protein
MQHDTTYLVQVANKNVQKIKKKSKRKAMKKIKKNTPTEYSIIEQTDIHDPNRHIYLTHNLQQHFTS